MEGIDGTAQRLVPAHAGRIGARHQMPEHDEQNGETFGDLDVLTPGQFGVLSGKRREGFFL